MPNSNGNILNKLTLKVQIYLVIIGVLCIVLCTYDIRWIIPSILMYIALILYAVWIQDKKKTEIVNHIQEVASDVNSATKNNLINSPVPLVLIETDGNIVWRSKKFVEEFSDVEINTYLIPIVKEIKLDIEKTDTNKEITKQFNIDKKVYKIRGAISTSKKHDNRKQKEYLLTLYFIDDTKYNELFDLYNNSKTCVAIAMVDNFEDIVQKALSEKKIDLISKIEKELLNEATKTGGLIVKTERDSFVYIFEQKYLTGIEKANFEVLDKVKTIETDTNTKVTLSIAVSNEGSNYYEKYKSALTAMDLVLGRGGDQAVVRKDGKYKFYGGRTLEIEKRTKIKARTISHSISSIMKEAENIVIMGHVNIDIDAIGSALGLYRMAKSLGKDCYIVSEPKGKSLDKFLEHLEKQDEYTNVIIPEEKALEIITENSVLMVVDTNRADYVEFPELLDKTERKIVIDHHRKGTDYIDNTIIDFHEVYASSTAELVTEIIQYAGTEIQLTLLEAESLYGGIMIDTKDFTFKTGVRTFEAAAYLRKFGVDIIRVKKWFQSDLESYNLIAKIVQNCEIVNDVIAISVYEDETKDANLICAKSADELLTISNISASFVIGKIEDKVYISGRSVGDINVQLILEKMGGRRPYHLSRSSA